MGPAAEQHQVARHQQRRVQHLSACDPALEGCLGCMREGGWVSRAPVSGTQTCRVWPRPAPHARACARTCQRPSRQAVACGLSEALSALTASFALVVSYLHRQGWEP